jgi:predicted site-specific integrase-resolvase
MVATFSEAARRLPVSRATLYRWRENGLLAAPYLRADGRLELEPPGQMTLAEYCEAVAQVQIRY